MRRAQLRRDAGCRLADAPRRRRRRGIDRAARARHQGGELVQRLDLVGDDPAHVGGRFLRLLRQLDRAAADLGAGRLELVLDLRRHRAKLARRVAEAPGRGAERLAHLVDDLLIGLAQRRGRAGALLAGGRAHALELLADGARRRLGAVCQHRADLARLRLGVAEQVLDEARESGRHALELVRALADAGEQALERLPPLAERRAHARLDLLERACRVRKRPQLLAGALGERTAALVERRDEIAGLLQRPVGDAAQRLDLTRDLARGAAGSGAHLGENRLELIDAADKAFVQRAEIAAAVHEHVAQKAARLLQPPEHAVEIALQALVRAGKGRDRAGGAFIDGAPERLRRLAIEGRELGDARLQAGQDRRRAFVERSRHRLADRGDLACERAAALADGVDERRPATVEQVADLEHPLAERVDHGVAAVVEDVVESRGAALEQLLDLGELMAQRPGDGLAAHLEQPGGVAGAIVEDVRDLLDALGERRRERLAAQVEHPRQRRGALVDQSRELGHVAVEAADEQLAAPVEKLLDLAGAAVEQLMERGAAFVEHRSELRHARAERPDDALGARVEQVVDLGDALAEERDDAVAAIVEELGERGAAAVEQVRHLGHAVAERAEDGPAAILELRRHRRRAVVDQLGEPAAAILEDLRELVGSAGQVCGDVPAAFIEHPGERIGMAGQRRSSPRDCARRRG